MDGTNAILFGEIDAGAGLSDLSGVFLAAGYDLETGRFALRLKDFPHFVIRRTDLGSRRVAVEADADTIDPLLLFAEKVSRTLALAAVCHRFEVYLKGQDDPAAYFHHDWPRPQPGQPETD